MGIERISMHNIISGPQYLPGGKMLPSAKARQANKHSFSLYYNDLCVLNGLTPLNTIKAHLKNDTLDFYGDRLKLEEWIPILKALRSDRHLRFLAIRSRTPSSVLAHVDTAVKAQQCTHRPVLFTRYIMKMLITAVSSCLSRNMVLACVELESMMLTKGDVEVLVKGISLCSSLQNLSFHRSPLDEACVQLICRCVQNKPLIESLDLTGCGVTEKGAHDISGMLKHQKLTMYDERWKLSLRDQQQDDVQQLPGLKRLTLNDNSLLGNRGAMDIVEEIADHMWFKALDLQHCGLTDVAAGVVLAMLQTNTWLAIVDLRANDSVSPVLLKLIMQQLSQNNAANSHQYHWISNVKCRPTGLRRLMVPGRGRRRPVTASSSYDGEEIVPGYAQPRPGPRISARDTTSGTRLTEQYQLEEPPYIHTSPTSSISGEKHEVDSKNASIELLNQRLEEVTLAMASLSRCYETEVARRKSAEAELQRIRNFLGEQGTGNIILHCDTVQDIQDAFATFSKFLETVRSSGLAPRLEKAIQKEADREEDLPVRDIGGNAKIVSGKTYKSSRRYRENTREKLSRRASAPAVTENSRIPRESVRLDTTTEPRRREFDDLERSYRENVRNNRNQVVTAAMSRVQAIFTQMTHGDGNHVTGVDLHKERGTADGRKRDIIRKPNEMTRSTKNRGKRLPDCGVNSEISSQTSAWSMLSSSHSSTDYAKEA